MSGLIQKIVDKTGGIFTIGREGVQDPETAAEQLKADYRIVFSTPEGRRVLEDLAVQAGLLASSFTPGDPQATAFKEGQRNLFIHILAQVKLVEG